MDVRRARIPARAALTVLLLSGLTAGPASAADCSLEGPHAVRVGDALTIAGTGFPASSSVNISLTPASGVVDEFSLPSSATGSIQIALTPESSDVGTLEIVASAGSACTAQVEVTIVGAGATLPPEPQPQPGIGVAGEASAPPRTDSSDDGGPLGASSGSTAWVLAVVLLVIGAGGLLATRRVRRA